MKIDRITEINQDLIQQLNETFVRGEPDGKSGEWDFENATRFVNNPDNIFLLAYVEDDITGMVSAYKLQRMDSKKAELFFYEIGVVRNYRQQGIGKALIEELKRIGKGMGVNEMFVLTNRSNTAAVKLYESTGGTPSKETDEIMFTYKI
jgi:ribosomal protein S18 acetylase RimI-like enzyme